MDGVTLKTARDNLVLHNYTAAAQCIGYVRLSGQLCQILPTILVWSIKKTYWADQSMSN